MTSNPTLLYPLIVFCLATLFTPGPNNMMLMVSGLNFGLRKTLPHLFGVVIGFAFLVLCVGLGLGVVFKIFPVAYTVLKYVGAAYMLYLAWVIAMSDPKAPAGGKRKRPFTFIEAGAFQWVNPKAWIMGIGAMSTYAAIASYPANAIVISVVFGFLGIASCFLWAGFGTALQHLLHRHTLIRAFNIVMALLLMASIYPVFRE